MKDGTSLCLHTYLLLVSSHGSVWGGGGQGRCVTCICTLALTRGLGISRGIRGTNIYSATGQSYF